MKHTRRDFAKSATGTLGVLGLGCGSDALPDASPSSNPSGPGSPRETGSGGMEGSNSGTGGNGSGGTGTGGNGTGGDGSGSTGTGGDGTGGNATGGDGGGPALTCGDLTETDIQGPFFRDGSPESSDIVGAEPGPKLRLGGKVLDQNCVPIAGALIDFWQADEAGGYDDVGRKFRGHQFSRSDGTYDLATIIPGRYLNGAQFRPAHIHVKVTVNGKTLTTQLYFPDDPFNSVDPWYRDVLAVAYTGSGSSEATFDFVVERELG